MASKRKAEGEVNPVQKKQLKRARTKAFPPPVQSAAAAPPPLPPKKAREANVLIDGNPVGAPPYLNSTIANGKIKVEKPKEIPRTEQPEGDHPSQENPISTQEYEQHYDEDGADKRKELELQMDSDSSDSEDEKQDDNNDGDEAEESEEEEEEPQGNPEEGDDPLDCIRFPSTIAVVSKQFGGKTNLGMLFLDKHAKDFDNVFIIGRSAAVKKYLAPYATSKNHVLKDLSEQFLKDMLDWQKKTNAKTLVFFDDATGMKFKPTHSDAWKEWITTARNQGATNWVGVQSYKMMDPYLRDNATYHFLGNNFERTIGQLAEELGNATMSRKDMHETLSDIARKNRPDYKSFLFIDHENQRYHKYEPECVKE